MIHAISVNVYKFPLGECSNNGISSRFRDLLVACPDGPYSFDPAVETPINFCMVARSYGRAYIVPACVAADNKIVARPGWFMNGGNIADSSDSRFKEITGVDYPLRIHDRKEW